MGQPVLQRCSSISGWQVAPEGSRRRRPFSSSQLKECFPRVACWGRVFLWQTPFFGVLRGFLVPGAAPTFRVCTHHGPLHYGLSGVACYAEFLTLGSHGPEQLMLQLMLQRDPSDWVPHPSPRRSQASCAVRWGVSLR